ncbi:MAG TPA: hypothetical protein EYP56_16265 [Planctomycetaceae bacterium]|nr:hypothetical protein [Planctomycetaceae bacterium]
MRVRELIELLQRFDPESEVHMSVALPGRVISTHENIWVADYGGGPQLNAALDFKQFHVYVGCGLEQMVTEVPRRRFVAAHEIHRREPEIDLGQYETEELAAKVRDFYNYHRRPGEPLAYPDFDYENWIPPRTTSGEYNEHIAAILKEKLLRD